MSNTVGMLAKNLQVVSFDGDWKEIYLGTVRKNHFTAFCPNEVSSAVDIDFKWMHEDEGKLEKDSICNLYCPKNLTFPEAKREQQCPRLVVVIFCLFISI